ncbi:hypothetical protein MNBD_PLANCTO03-1037 [hydrothermal vent metagenome]|uniref:Prepilin-type N-terminal cleavage/methylation domain-containing protein n=1 Tax=hydrothermal vent metagenome TaxID=652676 RepID=A0A3B1DRN8_9ZZZZ
MHMRTTQNQAARPPFGFTLIELIVAIGAIAILAVGIASIFGAVGKTVAGGRRVSNLNEYASLIERQMRADFQAMTRDGVLVIRHEEANEGLPVQLHPDDFTPRPRRIDQIIFFRHGNFSTTRAPVIPGFNATSSEAMIRYGHGMRFDPLEDYLATPAFELPQVDDGRIPATGSGTPFRDDLALGEVPSGGANPNLYASAWTLQRQVTLLTPPSSADQDLPFVTDPIWGSGVGQLGLDRIEALDNEIQITGQPAASSPFTTLQALFPTVFPTNFVRGAAGDGDRHPTIASGLVDIATTDLAEIRRIISDVAAFPWDITAETDLFDPTTPASSLFDDQFDRNAGVPLGDIQFIHAWMDDLFPTNPHPNDNRAPATTAGIRPRYEPALPDLIGTLANYDNNTSGVPVFEQNLRLADQQVLGSSVFVPQCTEFIVEYSFGQVVDNISSPLHGQLIWFGKQRDLTIEGIATSVIRPYPTFEDPFFSGTLNTYIYNMPYRRLDGTPATQPLPISVLYQNPAPAPDDFPDIVTAHFGYIHPYYAPTNPDGLDPETLPWPWPKLIRVTMTLADPVDPSIEQTFQFVFETPETDAF